VSGYPTDVVGLGNYVQISNPYTLSKMVGKDAEGNQKTQQPDICLHDDLDKSPVLTCGGPHSTKSQLMWLSG
jgi:hypothetical protein